MAEVYKKLTKYIPLIEGNNLGEWIVDGRMMAQGNILFIFRMFCIQKWSLTWNRIFMDLSMNIQNTA